MGALIAFSVYTEGDNCCRKLNLLQQSDMKETKLQNVERLTTGELNKESLLVDAKVTSSQPQLESPDHRGMKELRSFLGRVIPDPPDPPGPPNPPDPSDPPDPLRM